MKRRIVMLGVCLCTVVVVTLAAGTTSPAEKPKAQVDDKLVFKNNGFAISPLDEPAKNTQLVLSMYIPSAGRFASNVTVMIQPFAGNLDEYIDLSKKQFKEGNLKIIADSKLQKSIWLVEYTGEMGGKDMHLYSRATLKAGKVYLVTGTSTADSWKTTSLKLKPCVDSFETIDTQGSAVPTSMPSD